MIVKRLPRHDRKKDDFLGIKRKLSNYANACLDQLWVKRGSPDSIRIVEIAGIESDGYLHDILYGERGSEHYDGIHLNGVHAARHLTYRVIQALKSDFLSLSKSRRNVEKITDYHRSCPQALYKARQQRAIQQSSRSQPRSSSPRVLYSDIVSGSYSIPTYNRFAPLN